MEAIQLLVPNEINTISRNILKYKDKFLETLSKEFNTFANNFIQKYDKQLNIIIDYITDCDIIQNRCYVAETFSYTKPTLVKSDESFINFKGLRHPLIEKLILMNYMLKMIYFLILQITVIYFMEQMPSEKQVLLKV